MADEHCSLKEARQLFEDAGLTCTYQRNKAVLVVSASDKPDGTGGLREIRRFEEPVSIYDIRELIAWQKQRK